MHLISILLFSMPRLFLLASEEVKISGLLRLTKTIFYLGGWGFSLSFTSYLFSDQSCRWRQESVRV